MERLLEENIEKLRELYKNIFGACKIEIMETSGYYIQIQSIKNHDILGSIQFYYYEDENKIHVTSLFVEEEFRNKSYGIFLMFLMFMHTINLKVNEVTLDDSSDNTGTTESLYYKLGFRVLDKSNPEEMKLNFAYARDYVQNHLKYYSLKLSKVNLEDINIICNRIISDDEIVPDKSMKNDITKLLNEYFDSFSSLKRKRPDEELDTEKTYKRAAEGGSKYSLENIMKLLLNYIKLEDLLLIAKKYNIKSTKKVHNKITNISKDTLVKKICKSLL